MRIYSKDEKFTLSDLSELCYNINNIYKILILDKEKKKKSRYYLKKLPDKDSLFVDKISKQSPFFIEISSAISWMDIIQTLIGVIGIAGMLKQNRPNNRKEIREKTIKELRRKRMKISDELISETIRLSKRRIRIEEILED